MIFGKLKIINKKVQILMIPKVVKFCLVAEGAVMYTKKKIKK